MIFKPSSLPKLFFTYICPRFYGGAPSVPSNTTTTSTVNQSPWQNPVYQALMLGTAEKPGPVTSMLNASNEQMAQWNAINKTGLTREAQAGLGTWNPTISAGTSTLVDKVNQDTGKYETIVNPSLYQKDSAGHYTPTPQAHATDELKNTYQTYLGRAPDAPGQAYWLDSYKRGVPSNDITASIAGSDEAKAYAAKNAAKYAPISATTSQDVANSVTDFRNARQAPADSVPGAAQGGLMGLRGYASGGDTAKPSTEEIKKFVADNMGNPKLIASKAKEFGLSNQDLADATGYNLNDVNNFLGSPTGQAPYGLTDTLSKTAYFDPVTGKSTLPDFLTIQDKARNLETPEQFKAATDMYGQSSAGLAAAANYTPTNISASKADVANAAAVGYKPTDMQGAAGVSADKLTDYQMQGPSAVNAPTATAAQMAGPQSWLDQGTAAAYMNPYTQNVINQEKIQANRDYQQQLNQLNAQSVKAGAFGGSRQAIQQAEAARNQAFNLANIEAKGLENAYSQGAQQFNTAQGQQLQAGQANLGATQQTSLANQAAQIQAMMANQGMDYNTAFQNLQARMGIQNTASSQALQAALANQQTQQQTQATNAAARNQAAQFTSGATNAANLANAGAANTASNAYAQNQLAAGQANQQAGLSANQQGISALQGVGQNASGLAQTGSAQNAANLANLGAAGQVAQAEQNLGQQYVDTETRNAQSWLNMPTSINAGASNVVNAQPVQGGTAGTTTSARPASAFGARGGLIKNGKVSKRGVK